MSSDFLNRGRELAQLDEMFARPKAQLVAVYGRRRIGKTTLLVHWLARDAKRSVYWVAQRSTSRALLAKFSQMLAPLLDTADPAFTFSSWEAAFHQVAELAARKPMAVVIDELPYLLESEPGFATMLQALWDRELSRSKVRLFLAGSHYHMMLDTLASPKGALYGRTTADIFVDELAVEDMALFLPAYSPEQLVETYSVVGGVPRYLEAWHDGKSVLANLRASVLSPVSIFRNEPAFLIQDEISEPRTYLAILEAIGGGMKPPIEIARAAGVQLAHVGKYLYTLEGLRFVRRVVSAEHRGARAARSARYEIRDPYLRFHFAFVQPNVPLLEQGRLDRLMELIRAGFDAYVGRNGYEELCRRHVAVLADRGELPFDALDVGRMWDRRVEIDVVALDRKARNVLLGDCRWRRGAMGVETLDELRARASALRKLRGVTLHYALFSRAGFTKALVQRARAERVLLVEGVPGLR